MRIASVLKLAGAASLAVAGAAAAQVSSVDPNAPPPASSSGQASAVPAPPAPQDDYQPVDSGPQAPAPNAPAPASAAPSASERASASIRGDTVPRKDVFSAAEGVFGKGAEGLGDLVEKLLREQGEPTAYITGREAGGAFVVGVRYGSGTLHHQIEGDRPVYWTGPSVGFDAGADASKVFVLVYNLHDSQRLYRRYPAAEGNAYVVGGFTASYLRRGDI
ncbi:MAG TPA: EipA family protein, partial [Allosphingosinicella sp.]